ncbi:MAG: hypothetical protein SGILL_005771, partial [Bacillariaceae sp.]
MPSSNSPEEWDVLQAILGEESDDDEDHDMSSGYDINANMGDYDSQDDDDPVMVQHSSKTSRKNSHHNGRGISSSFNASRNKVDLILQQSDDEDDVDIDESILSASKNHRFMSTSLGSSLHKPTAPDLTDVPADSFVTAAQSEETEASDPKMAQSSTIDEAKRTKHNTRTALSTPTLPATVPSSYRREKQHATKGNRKEGRQGKSNIASSDVELEKASQKALQVAKAQERKLLKSGHRDIVSPLMVKRRLKPRIELGTRTQKQRKEREASQAHLHERGVVGAAHRPTIAPRFSFAGGIIDTKNMASVSKHLYDRCRSHQDLPTAMAINSRFLSVGTQKGVILVFDLFEVLRQKLGGSSSAGNDGNVQFNHKTAGSVTTIDLSLVQGEFLIAGYTGGNIVLWDTIKGVALKSIVETATPSPIVSVRFLSDLKVVSVDAGGLVNKLNFSKNMLWTTYSVESELLLDGTAGQILAMNVLPPYKHVKQQLPQGSSALMKRLVLLALSSERSSFAVAVEPKVH